MKDLKNKVKEFFDVLNSIEEKEKQFSKAEDELNHLKIQKAKLQAEIESEL
ncbi:MAG: hypothetical protein KKE05_06765 [Nanoarchaeota archaeon]|nr:hypothetical protein [Nanoarchaeota archaeon]